MGGRVDKEGGEGWGGVGRVDKEGGEGWGE